MKVCVSFFFLELSWVLRIQASFRKMRSSSVRVCDGLCPSIMTSRRDTVCWMGWFLKNNP